MPLNFFYAALIHAALPNARIVCLRRNPMDACLSNVRQLFATRFSYYDYSLDLLDTGRYYMQFDSLMATWRHVLPQPRFIEIQYEALVANQEPSHVAWSSSAGWSWNDACLDFHTNAAPVATASSVQVRSPIYSHSVGRWKRYGDQLDALRAFSMKRVSRTDGGSRRVERDRRPRAVELLRVAPDATARIAHRQFSDPLSAPSDANSKALTVCVRSRESTRPDGDRLFSVPAFSNVSRSKFTITR